MTDRKKQELLPPITNARLPAVRPPQPSLPSLPSSSGQVSWTPKRALEKDTGYLGAYAAKLRAMADQAAAYRELVEKRDALALAIANLESLPERCVHQYEMGRLSRHHERALLLMQHEHEILEAKIRSASAQVQLAQYLPIPEAPPAPPPQPAPTGLTPADVEKVARGMPEFQPDTIQTLIYALGGMMAEKNK